MAVNDFKLENLNLRVANWQENNIFPCNKFEYKGVSLLYLGQDTDCKLIGNASGERCGQYIYNDTNGNLYSVALYENEGKIILRGIQTKLILNKKINE